jgi:2-amino-4-hydroxy-6-hydroxymethyldihydropteridine diphosphokinase
MSVIAYIGIGSNMGDKTAACLRAFELLERTGRVVKRSSLYRTAPVGYTEQEDFINAVAAVETELPPRDLLRACLAIEDEMGRKRTMHWGPRTLDLDILLYGAEVISDPDLLVPHPLMAARRFVLAPLAEVAPGVVHPVLNKTALQLLAEVRDPAAVTRCSSLTDRS